MDRRQFLKLAAASPMLLLLEKAAASPGACAPGKEIVLLDTFVAGWQYHQGDEVWAQLQADASLALKREPDNPYDDMAIAVYGAGVMLGYIPRVHNTVIAGLMDQKAPVKCRVLIKHKTSHPWEKMEIRVTMAI